MTSTKPPAAIVAVIASAMCVATAPPSWGADEIALNGKYTAFSDGQWAQTNQSYHDEASVTQTWTIASSCTTYQDCTGSVSSDQGWTADLVYVSGIWKLHRVVPNWEQCIDGTASPGNQGFTFWADPDHPGQYTGRDMTIGPSGACGFNKWLNISLPLTVTPLH